MLFKQASTSSQLKSGKIFSQSLQHRAEMDDLASPTVALGIPSLSIPIRLAARETRRTASPLLVDADERILHSVSSNRLHKLSAHREATAAGFGSGPSRSKPQSYFQVANFFCFKQKRFMLSSCLYPHLDRVLY